MNDLKIGEFIATLRKEKNMTQKELAEKLNVTDKAISKWERDLGYPDITIISSLSKILNVTESELLNGKKNSIDSNLNYSEVADYNINIQDKPKIKKKLSKSILISIISIAFIIAVFVCTLCDFVINGEISWSLYPTFSTIFVWLISVTSICSKKHKVVKTLLVFSVLVLPFLYSMEYCTKINGWFINLAVPITIVSLVYIWIFAILYLYAKFNKFYITSIAILCSILLTYIINYYVDLYVAHSRSDLEIFLNTSILTICSLTFFFIGTAYNKKKSNIVN